MTYLFLGQDQISKDAKIAELKKRHLSSQGAIKFDYEVLYAHKLEPETLKKTLISLPVLSKERLVVIKECHRLSPYNQGLILEFVKNPGRTALILDSDKLESNNSFVKKLGKATKILNFKKEAELNVFHLTRAISAGKSVDALKILAQLLSKGEQPLQIMGGLVWFWKNARGGFSLEQFKKGLMALQEADLNIKRSRLRPEHALELLMVKLCFEEVC